MQFQDRKRKRRCEHECKEHIFQLRSLRSNSSKYDIKLQFCPKFQRDPLPPEHTFPQFNEDCKYYTSAFLLGVDKRILLKNQQQEIMDHQKQIRDSLQKHNQLVFPRPSSKHTLCSVCKQHFRNYYYHIGSDQHRERIGLSAYNVHILNLCNLYFDLWQGCEDKADEDAQRRALEEVDRRLRIEDAGSQQDYSNSLADCQRGSVQQRYDENGNPLMVKSKMSRRASSRNDDTMPLIGRKRSNPDGRSLYEPAMRKHIFGCQTTSVHTARERKERNYERQRMKMMRGTQFQKYKKDYVPMPSSFGDVFFIMRPTEGYQAEREYSFKKYAENNLKISLEKMAKKQLQEQIIKNKYPQERPQQQKQYSPMEEIQRQEIKQSEGYKGVQSIQEGQLSGSSDGFFSRRTQRPRVSQEPRYRPSSGQKKQGKVDPRYMHNYGYPPYHGMPMPHYLPPPSNKNGEAYKMDQERYKVPVGETNPDRFKGYGEGYKGLPPNYYYPCGYHPMYDPQQYAVPQDKAYKGIKDDKQKSKSQDKPPYDYQMPYPWNYPYYIPQAPHSQHPQSGQDARIDHPPPPPPPPSQSSTSSSNKTPRQNANPYFGSTNINISIPMYMYPHHPHHSYDMQSRYPMMDPYEGYQPYSYMDRGKGENREYDHHRTKEGQPQHPGKGQIPPPPPPPPPGVNHQPQRYTPPPYVQNSSQKDYQGQQIPRGHSPGYHPYYPQHYMQYHQGYHKQKSPTKKET